MNWNEWASKMRQFATDMDTLALMSEERGPEGDSPVMYPYIRWCMSDRGHINMDEDDFSLTLADHIGVCDEIHLVARR